MSLGFATFLYLNFYLLYTFQYWKFHWSLECTYIQYTHTLLHRKSVHYRSKISVNSLCALVLQTFAYTTFTHFVIALRYVTLYEIWITKKEVSFSCHIIDFVKINFFTKCFSMLHTMFKLSSPCFHYYIFKFQ